MERLNYDEEFDILYGSWTDTSNSFGNQVTDSVTLTRDLSSGAVIGVTIEGYSDYFFEQKAAKKIELKSFTAKNYKNFGTAKFSVESPNLNLLYSETGTGKTNFGEALMDIKNVFFGYNAYGTKENIKNIYSFADIGFNYEFVIDGHILKYCYAKNSNNQLSYEGLIYDGKTMLHVDFLALPMVVNEGFFGIDKKMIVECVDHLHKSYGNQSFVQWILENTSFNPNSIMANLYMFVRRMNSITVSPNVDFIPALLDQDEIEGFNNFLKGQGYTQSICSHFGMDKPTKLYIEGEISIPFFETASDGEKALSNLYFELHRKAKKHSLVYIDDIDKYFDPSLTKRALEYLRYVYSDTTFIATSSSESAPDFATVLQFEL
ncbi:hypothetical protein [Ileibacterium valens]|uniref:hypothetical protein n=1 Tax=Ileibacterium valens TaxID=1862668 RepID=UPI002357715B|nr:hypothetical protein [Ileibacterium valens]